MQVLWVDKLDSRRGMVRRLAQSRNVALLDATDAFAAMGALGRADFDCLVLAEEPRLLSMRGLLMLAQKRHPNIRLYVLLSASGDGSRLRDAMGVTLETVEPDTPLEGLLDHMAEQLAATQPFELPASVQLELAGLDATTQVSARVQPEDPTLDTPMEQAMDTSEEPTLQTGIPLAALDPDQPAARRAPLTPAAAAPAPVSTGKAKASSSVRNAITLPMLPRFVDLPEGSARSSATSTENVPTPPFALAPAAAVRPAPPPPAPPAPPAAPSKPAPVVLGPPAEAPRQTNRIPTQPQDFTSVSTDPAASASVHLEGELSQASGSALLLGLFAQELTGRLVIHGGAEGTLYLLRGEPVYAEEPDGDVALWDRCLRAGVVPQGRVRPAVPQGQLGSLLASMVSGEALHNVLRTMVRERVLMLAGQHDGSYTFDEETAFLDVVPLFKVNPVGLVVEAVRRGRPPDKLLERSKALEDQYLHSGPGLGAAAPKLTPFLRGGDALSLVNGHRTVAQFCADSQLGPLMGTLMVEMLLDARLASLHRAAYRPNTSEIALRPLLGRPAFETTQLTPVVPDADVEAATREDSALRNHIFSLYARLKPLRVPRQVLGVAPYANRADIDAAYNRLMADLSVKTIPEGSARALLVSRVDEVRQKVQASYQALLLELSDDEGSNSNPF